MYHSTKILIFVFSLGILPAVVYASQDKSQLYFYKALNHTSANQPSWPPATGRITFSAGAENVSFEKKDEREHTTKTQISCGLSPFYPLSMGLILGQIPSVKNQNFIQLASYFQWTIFEGFGLPTLSLKGQFAKLLPNKMISEGKSYSFGSQMSWGYSKFTLYGGLNMNSDHFTIYDEYYFNQIKHLKSTSNSLNFGVHFQIVPGSVALAVEKTIERDIEQVRGKIIVEL